MDSLEQNRKSMKTKVTDKILFENDDHRIRFALLPFDTGRLNYTITEKDVLFLLSDGLQLDCFKKCNFIKQCLVLCNEPEERAIYTANGIYSAYINQNAFINENNYSIKNVEKKWDALILETTRPLQLAILTHKHKVAVNRNFSTDYTDFTKEILNHYKNLEAVEIDQETYHAARCALFISPNLGPCHQSSECLLSGIPIVSIPSLGGRHVWYDIYNSIIAEYTPESIEQSIEFCIKSKFNAQQIRDRHIKLAQSFRDKFCKILAAVLRIELKSAKEIFENNIRNKVFET